MLWYHFKRGLYTMQSNIIYPGDAAKVFVTAKLDSNCIQNVFTSNYNCLQSYSRFTWLYSCKNDENSHWLGQFIVLILKLNSLCLIIVFQHRAMIVHLWEIVSEKVSMTTRIARCHCLFDAERDWSESQKNAPSCQALNRDRLSQYCRAKLVIILFQALCHRFFKAATRYE